MELKLVIDTGTWLKLDKLLKHKIIQEEFLTQIYDLAEVIITPQIETELIHFKTKSWKKDKTFIIPITNEKNYDRALKDGFDQADSSIFGIAEIDSYFILSEDRPLLNYGKMYRLNFLFLIEFFVILLKTDLITKNELYVLNKNLYELRNINKKYFHRIKQIAERY